MYGYEITSQNVKYGSGEFGTGHAHFFYISGHISNCDISKTSAAMMLKFGFKLFAHNVNCLRNIKKFGEGGCQIRFFCVELAWNYSIATSKNMQLKQFFVFQC